MDAPVVKNLKHLWEIWDLRAFMLISLFLQTFLILFAPLRKRTATNWTVIPLWSAYLLADWAATFAVGLISNSQNEADPSKKSNNADLLAFWAPILLVHLGGPDTITAFSLEDNELWIRHLLSLVTQTAAAVYVFIQSLPNNHLWAPTLLMFASGLIKYSERVMSLHSASLNSFRDSMLEDPDPGPTYAKLMNEYHWKKDANLPTRIALVPKPSAGSKGVNRVKEESLDPREVVLYAHQFFRIFKGLVVDLIFSQRERNQSRNFFRKRSPADAFRVVVVELNLMYDALFTKVGVVYTARGFYFRFASFACFVSTLGLFYVEDKGNFQRSDVAITYALLLGGIALDVVSFLMIVDSDWMMVATKKLPDVNLEPPPGSKNGGDLPESRMLAFRKVLLPRALRRRWCESVSAFNLIHYCGNRRTDVKEAFVGALGLTKSLDLLWFVEHKPFTEALRDHIFEELLAKSEMAEDLDIAKGISAAKGDWVLRFDGGSDLLHYVLDVDYDQSLLLWHVATELCYCDEKANPNDEKNKYRGFSKLLSDYMLYLLIMQPAMMSAVSGIGQLRFRDTCAEAIKFLEEEKMSDLNKRKKKKPNAFRLVYYGVYSFFKYLFVVMFYPIWLPLRCINISCVKCFFFTAGDKEQESVQKKGLHKKDCNTILSVNTDEVEPVQIKGDKSKSVLFDGCILAKRLKELDSLRSIDCKWKLMSKVWVEMLSYAAIHCRANSHVQELSRGGELITLVWLLMVHFGLGNQYQISEDHARAKLIVDK